MPPWGDRERADTLIMWIPDDLWATIQRSVPILCVDVVLIRDGDVGLTLRTGPFGVEPVWCHLGGRVNVGETVSDSVMRHVTSTVTGLEGLVVEDDVQPDYVMQWFTDERQYDNTNVYGFDPRQHAVSLVFCLDVSALPVSAVARGTRESLQFAWVPEHRVPHFELWPGSERLIVSTLAAVRSARRLHQEPSPVVWPAAGTPRRA